MNTESTTNQPMEKRVRKSMWKVRVMGILAVIVIALGAYGYFWYQQTNKKLVAAEQVSAQAEQFQRMDAALMTEYDRCTTFITQGEGNFGEFEYCQRFLDWVDGVTINR